MKMGSDGRPRITLPPKPRPVAESMDYWAEPPPVPSERLTYWLEQFERGWFPNRRICGMGYHGSAEWYGFYIWEYLNVIYPRTSR